MDDELIECTEFDLSALTYPQFLAFFFERPVVDDAKQYELFRSGIDFFIASNPSVVASHLQTMCRNYAELTQTYSREQLDQGLCAVFGAAISCERFVFDPAVDGALRTACIESMYVPFAEVASWLSLDILDTSFFFMWWDMVLHTFWGHNPWFRTDVIRPDYPSLGWEDPALLDEQGRQML